MNKLVVVTGGAGFIGSHLSEELLKRGYQVRVLDNLSQGQREWVPSAAEFVQGDIRDLDVCRAVCDKADGVFHLAAMSRVGPSIDNIDLCTSTNVVGTQNILTAARDARVGKVVYAGSSTFYGNQEPPHREDMRPEFLNAYSLSKYVGEEYCMLFDRMYNLPAAIVRFFNVYGERQPQTGAYALVLGIFLRQYADNVPLTIHGTGDQRRDFVHVRDVANATIAAFESDARREAFNIGSGTNYSIKELADLISSNQTFGPRRPGDAKDTLADISRAQARLNWAPRISMQEGLREMLDNLKPALAGASAR